MAHSLRHTAPAERVGEMPNILLLEKKKNCFIVSANSRNEAVFFVFSSDFAFVMNKTKGQCNCCDLTWQAAQLSLSPGEVGKRTVKVRV